MNIKHWIKQRLTKNVAPNSSALIILGVDYSSYQLLECLHLSHNYQVVTVIDDNPWAHRNAIAGVELRYPNELLALSKQKGVVAVLVTKEKDLKLLSPQICERLTRAKIKLLMVSPKELLTVENVDTWLTKQLS